MPTDTEFYDGLQVSIIATPREHFVSCSKDDDLADIVARNIAKFDFMPVKNHDGILLGIVELASYFDVAPPQGRVQEFLVPLGERHLIGADASILAFVRDADERRFRFVVSQHGIIGLVSLSDLQKLPVRAMLFSLVTALELRMFDVIRRIYPQGDDWKRHISKKRRDKISEELSKAAATEGIVDELLYTQLCDKRDILLKSLLKRHEKRSRFSSDLRTIEKLRNSLAHANDYAATSAKAAEVCQTVRDIIDIYELLDGL